MPHVECRCESSGRAKGAICAYTETEKNALSDAISAAQDTHRMSGKPTAGGGNMTRRHDTRRELDRAHHLLTRWAEWRIRLEGNELGRGGDTVEARLARHGAIRSGKPASAIVPTNIYCSEVVGFVDRAINRMPWCLYSAIAHKYLLGGTDAERAGLWTKSEGGTMAEYYSALKYGRIWVLAKLDEWEPG